VTSLTKYVRFSSSLLSITDYEYYITSRKIFQCQELVVLRQRNREVVNKKDSE